MALGGLVGFDREAAGKPAGFRTLMLVAGASALIVSLADAVVAHYATSVWLVRPADGSTPPEVIRADPIRVIEAVVTGVSFLGAGTIIRGRAHVEGLTTAASILFVAAVGIGTGLHQWVLSVGVTFLALVVLRLVKPLEERLKRGG
jgi:putative Mg2+ transporter-C (MgtC) family protein